MVTSVTKRRYGAGRRGGGTAPTLTPGDDGQGVLGRVSASCWERLAEHAPNAVEV